MKNEKKLELNRDTIRHLTEDELGDVDAAYAYLVERYPDYRLERLLREYSLPAYLGARPSAPEERRR